MGAGNNYSKGATGGTINHSHTISHTHNSDHWHYVNNHSHNMDHHHYLNGSTNNSDIDGNDFGFGSNPIQMNWATSSDRNLPIYNPHSHTVGIWSGDTYNTDNGTRRSNTGDSGGQTGWMSAGSGGTTTGEPNRGDSGSTDNLPPYYALAYIMRL